MPDAAGKPGRDAQHEVCPRRQRFGSDDGDDQGHRHPDELGEQDDAQKRRPTRQETATEVAGSPRDRRHETEDDRRRLGREDVAQVLRLEPARAAPPRAGVGCRAVGRRSADIESRRPDKLDDPVGRLVISGRCREIDHLEIGGDLFEKLHGLCGPDVIERHERIVEHERRPAVAGHEPDEPEASDEVDEIERALAQ